jgi:hypothetical protein
MRCEKNDQFVNDVKSDVFPSTFWSSDLWRCPVCGNIIATGFGRGQIAKRVTPGESLTFAHDPSQLTTFADQFEEPSDAKEEKTE